MNFSLQIPLLATLRASPSVNVVDANLYLVNQQVAQKLAAVGCTGTTNTVTNMGLVRCEDLTSLCVSRMRELESVNAVETGRVLQARWRDLRFEQTERSSGACVTVKLVI
ncbi:hypothetical protein K432DRAFT_148827 [Lepidopterella palustris CBS 459.81]|uniref:Uncharacterized protein n=1 Tax=Lepidopterella palustris CBS 459.81 TaxID=1314670 RepID=A0A8E2E2T6_9PEZI|nr:hypothetical protein K432DRAFT_148827 [Lepidopterella palustris CBS 459.81]